MSIKIGNSEITKIYLGQQEVSSLSFGSEEIWNDQPTAVLVKGDIIHFDAMGDGTQKRFRVLGVDGNICKLFSLERWTQTTWASSATPDLVEFSNEDQYPDYSKANVNYKVEGGYQSFYNSISNTTRNAIVDSLVKQTCWSHEQVEQGKTYDFMLDRASRDQVWGFNRIAENNIGYKKVHILDINDIWEYYGFEPNVLIDGLDILDLFYERDSYASMSSYQEAHMMSISYIDINPSGLNLRYGLTATGCPMARGYYGTKSSNSYGVYPIFRIDLSQIDYVKE